MRSSLPYLNSSALSTPDDARGGFLLGIRTRIYWGIPPPAGRKRCRSLSPLPPVYELGSAYAYQPIPTHRPQLPEGRITCRGRDVGDGHNRLTVFHYDGDPSHRAQ
jgi:hypothetical protein